MLSLSDISGWRAGVLYPLAGGGRDSGAAHLDLLGPPGRCSGWWPHDGDVAAGGDFVLAIVRFRVTMELGRSERPTLRPLSSYGVAGADGPARTPR